MGNSEACRGTRRRFAVKRLVRRVSVASVTWPDNFRAQGLPRGPVLLLVPARKDAAAPLFSFQML